MTKVEDNNYIAVDEESEKVNKLCFCSRICKKYDRSFLLVYGIQYANFGLKFLMLLALQQIFKEYYHLSPTETQVNIALFWMPFQFKIVYGIIADSIPLFGSRKRVWILLWGAIQTICLLILAVVKINSITTFLTLVILQAIG